VAVRCVRTDERLRRLNNYEHIRRRVSAKTAMETGYNDIENYRSFDYAAPTPPPVNFTGHYP